MLRVLHRQALCHGAHGRRTFFNLTNLSSLTPLPQKESQVQSYHERKIFPYPRSELYKIIADVASYSTFVPYCTGSRILESKACQDGTTVMEAELTVGFLAFRESYVSQVTCKPYESVEAVASSSTPLFETLTTVWRFQPVSSESNRVPPHQPGQISGITSRAVHDQGPTLVTLDLAFAFANPVHTTVSATFFGKVSKLMVKAFEERCAALHGPGAD